MKNNLLLLVCLLLFITACKKEVIPPEDVETGKEYYPLTTGHFIEYKVDSIIYNDFTKTNDSSVLYFKDIVGDKFLDEEGRESYIVNRYKRLDSTQNWQDFYTYYVTKTTSTVEVVEDNLRFIKLIFPVKLSSRWYGNIYVPSQETDLKWLGQWNYKYTLVSTSFNNGLQSYDNTLTVTEFPKDDVSNIGNPELYPDQLALYVFSESVYAKNVGLISKELTHWEYQPKGKQYRKGFTVIYKAYNFG